MLLTWDAHYAPDVAFLKIYAPSCYEESPSLDALRVTRVNSST
jgi:hypothetical protein